MTPETKAKLLATWVRFRVWLISVGHHARALGWIVCDAVWQLAIREPGGPASVLSWPAKRWALALAEALAPAFLLWLRAGDRTPTTEELTAAVEARLAQRGVPPPPARPGGFALLWTLLALTVATIGLLACATRSTHHMGVAHRAQTTEQRFEDESGGGVVVEILEGGDEE